MAPPAEQAVQKGRPALKLIKTQDLARQDWLAIRKQGIGSSDAAAAVGLNRSTHVPKGPSPTLKGPYSARTKCLHEQSNEVLAWS